MYSPTNTRCQIMSYRDLGAPPLKANDRNALFAWLTTVFSTGYNTQNILSVTSDGTQITINFNNGSFGYTVGQLLKISGATESVFNKLWRVQSIHETSVKCNIVDTDTYPASATGTLLSNVSSLDWEFVFTNASQTSIRSKMTNSSKSVITFKKPTGSILANKAAVVYEIEVSKNLNPTTGVPVDSLTSSYNITDNSVSVSSFYFIQNVFGTGNTIATTTDSQVTNQNYNLPWHVIGDGRIFYILIGNSCTSSVLTTNGNSDNINYDLSNIYNSYRMIYFFGDYNSFNEQNTINGNEIVINFPQYTSTNYTRSNFPEYALGYRNTTQGTYFLKNYIGQIGLSNVLYKSIGVNNTFVNFNPGSSSDSAVFPNAGFNGYVFFPFYLQENTTPFNIRGELPYAKYCPLSSSAISGNNTPLASIYDKRSILDNGEIYTTIPVYYASGGNGSYSYNTFFTLGV